MKSAAQNTAFSTNKTLNIQGRLLDLSRPHIMGILNVTPDSFYDGGKYASPGLFLKQVEKMLQDGATFIDVGGHSTRPGANAVTLEEEQKRVQNTIKSIAREFPSCVIAIDTYRSAIAHMAVQEGACLINDISGGGIDPRMFETVAKLQVPYILTHMRGTPATMNKHTDYKNLLVEIADFFHQNISSLHAWGVKDILIDPGFGFAKTVNQNFQLLKDLDYFTLTGKPLLVGLSRKSMIWRTLSLTPEEALNGSTALHAMALLKGASILRVHDVKEAMEVVNLYQHLIE